jgi:putative flippase GtrA
MPDELTTSVQLPFHHRVRHGVRRPHNWLQLGRFAAVGVSGYAVNLAAFAATLHLIGLDYRISAVVAYVVSVLNNFFWNRHRTFRARHGRAVHQGLRFFAVSLVTFAFSYVVLISLVEGAGMHKDLAQAISVAVGMPLNFLGQKLWSFRL